MSLRQSAFVGMVWGAGFTVVRDALQFATMIFMVRLLTPEAYGLAAVAQSIVGVIALISFRNQVNYALQERNPEIFDWGMHTSVGIVLGMLAFVASVVVAVAIWLAAGENSSALAAVISVYAATFLMEPFGRSYETYLQAHHRWKQYRLLMLISAVFSSICGILAAALGAGVFALAIMSPLMMLPYVIAYIVKTHPLRPTKIRLSQYHEGTRFGVLMATGGVFGTGTAVAEQSVMASWFGFSSLGIFTRASGLASMTCGKPGPVVVQTLYPVLTRAEAASDRFLRFSKILLSGIVIATLPSCFFLALEAERIVLLLYGPKWVEVSDILPLCAVVVAIGSITTVFRRILVANLCQGIAVRNEMIGGVSRLVVMSITLQFGIEAFVAGLVFQSFGVFLLSVLNASRVRAVQFAPLFKIICKTTAASIVAALVVRIVPSPDQVTTGLFFFVCVRGLIFFVFTIAMLRVVAVSALIDLMSILPAQFSHLVSRVLLLKNS